MPVLPSPVHAYHRSDLASGLRRVCRESELYWNAIPDEEFVAPMGLAWSPADHVRHLTKSVRAVAKGLQVPRLVLRLLYGRGKGVSMSYHRLVARYQEALARGASAGRFAPRPEHVPGDPAAYRLALLEEHRAAVHDLADRIMTWDRRQVDGLRMPHPLLGRLTVREMLMFTLYHNQHHVHVVARRRGEAMESSHAPAPSLPGAR